MTRSWSQMARTALDGGRIWRGLVQRQGLAESDLAFRATDMIVLGLLRNLAEIDVIVCPDHRLRDLIAGVLAEQGGEPAPLCLASDDGRPHLRLTSLHGFGEASAAAHAAFEVGYGASELLPLAAPTGILGVRLLACSAPALWQSGLALVVTPTNEAAVRALIAELALAMRGEWIDPLALYERVQILTAKLKSAGQSDDRDEAEPQGSRVADLERELASLKRAALVNQHLMLVDAAERVRNPT